MLLWENACPSDNKTLAALLILFDKHPHLLTYLFKLTRPELRLSSKTLLENAGVFSSGERLLINLGLGLWDGSGHSTFKDLYQIPDLTNFKNIMETLCFLRDFPISKFVDNENSPPLPQDRPIFS